MNDVLTLKDISNENLDKVAAMIGQKDNRKGGANTGFPRLAIEQQNENDSGDVLPKGSFRLKTGNDVLYAKDLEVRLFVRYYSYDLWNNSNPELSVRTVLQPSLSDNFPDTSGGERCGKLSKDEIAALPKNSIEHARQSNIKATQVVYGVVHKGSATRAESDDEVDVSGTPFIWSARDSAFMPVANYIREIPSNKIMFSQKVKISTSRNKNGTVIYYTPVFDKPAGVQVKDKDIELVKSFMEDIGRWNDRVLKEYNERKESVLSKEDLEVSDVLEEAI